MYDLFVSIIVSCKLISTAPYIGEEIIHITEAIAATFERRRTPLPYDVPMFQ